MKTKNRRTKYLISILVSIFMAEFLLQFDNKIIQCLGICVLPIIVIYSVLLIRNEQQKIQ